MKPRDRAAAQKLRQWTKNGMDAVRRAFHTGDVELIPLHVKADKQVFALPEAHLAFSALQFSDPGKLKGFMERRAALLQACGACEWLNLPRKPRTVEGEGGMYLVEEMLLSQSDGPLDSRVEDLTRALAGMHRAGWVHMDVKPEHLLYAQGRWMLHDFDGAMPAGTRFTHRDISFAYAPPDVRWHDRADPGDDLYAAALMLYQWKAGRLPGRRERYGLWTKAGIPQDWGDAAQAFFRRALAVRRRRRFRAVCDWVEAWRQVETTWKAGEEHGKYSQK